MCGAGLGLVIGDVERGCLMLILLIRRISWGCVHRLFNRLLLLRGFLSCYLRRRRHICILCAKLNAKAFIY